MRGDMFKNNDKLLGLCIHSELHVTNISVNQSINLCQSGSSCAVAYSQGHRHCVRLSADLSGPAGRPRLRPVQGRTPEAPEWCAQVPGVLVLWEEEALCGLHLTHFWHRESGCFIVSYCIIITVCFIITSPHFSPWPRPDLFVPLDQV